jgi:hypothetical protein
VTPPRDDKELRGPTQLSPPRVPVVRLNHRVLYVVGAVLVIVAIAAPVALRAQSSRLAQDGNMTGASHLSTGRRAVVRQGPRPRAEPSAGAWQHASDESGAGASCESPPAPAKMLSDADLEAQHRELGHRAAVAAPFASERSATGIETAPATAGSIILAGARAVAAGIPSAPRPAAPPVERPATLRGPVSPYQVKAGTIVPAVLLTGVNSNLPGQLIEQGPGIIFDTETGQRLRVQRAREPRTWCCRDRTRHGVPMKLKPVQTYPAALLKDRVPPR